MPFQIIRNDITKVKADAIVNSANPEPKYASGTDTAVYKAAGAEQLLEARKKIGAIPVGGVAVTEAFGLHAKYILHTVAPAWQGGKSGELEALKNCYRNSLEKAKQLGCGSIAFPLLAAGNYGFPKAEALRIAMEQIGSFLLRDDVEMAVQLVVFDEKAFRLSRDLFFQVESYITDEDVLKAHLEEYGIDGSDMRRARSRLQRGTFHTETGALRQNRPSVAHHGAVAFDETTFDKDLYQYDRKEQSAFRDHLMNLLVEKGIDNSVVYKRSNVSKGAFSKILCGDTKKPQKKTVLGFCIGLRLTLTEAQELLASADMAFNPYDKRDRLVIQCIEHEQYDINKVNMMLYLCRQPLLGN